MSEATATAGAERVSDAMAGPKVRGPDRPPCARAMLMVLGIVAVAIGSGAFLDGRRTLRDDR